MIQKQSQSEQIHPVPLAIPMTIGAAIALALISAFLYDAGTPKPEWPTYWRVRPMLLVPFAGAVGGLCWYLMDYVRAYGGWKIALANVLSVIIYIFGLWIGTVLGLVGTYWD